MTHLTPDELVDAVENRLPNAREAHLGECGECHQQVARLAGVLDAVREVQAPQPSPLFWERFPDRVRTAIAAAAARPPRIARWFQWPVLVPVGALAVLILTFASAVPHDGGNEHDSAAADDTDLTLPADGGLDADAEWELVAALVGEVDFDDVAQAGIASRPGSADDAALQLSLAEQEELARLLRQELERSGG